MNTLNADEKIVGSIIGFFAFLFFIVLPVILFFSISIIPNGHIGIQSLFGNVKESYLMPGFNMTNPLYWVTKLDMRTQKADEEGIIPSKEMLNMNLKTTVNFHIEKEKAIELYKTLGEDYFDKFIEPHIRSSLREVTSEYRAEQFFSSDRYEIQRKIEETMRNNLTPRGVIIESVMMKEIFPPETVRIAIESKQAQQQEAEEMKFKLQKEQLEAERKAIEARGIQNFQEIVKQGIDDRLLAWKGIEATEMLSKSPNSKIIIIGNSKGMPLIMPTN